MNTIQTVPTWNAQIVRGDRRFPEIEDSETGAKIRICVMSTAVVISRNEHRIIFPVSRRKGHLTFTDNREMKTGTFYDRREDRQVGAGSKKSLTATAWIQEVSRLIGRERANQIVSELR